MSNDRNDKMALACVAVSIAGLIIMIVSNSFYDAPRIELGSITKEMAGEKVVLCGTAGTSRDNGKGTVFLKLSSGGKTFDAVFFQDVSEKAAAIKSGREICIEGTVQVYNGDLELVGRKITEYAQ